jgi:hypothetical protein
MKKSFAIISFLMIANIFPLNAQRFGLKFAFSKPDLSSKFDFKQDNTQIYQGYQFGIYGRSDSRIYLQPEIYYHKKQAYYFNKPGTPGFIPTDSIFSQNITLHTINIPLVLGLNIIKLENFNIHIFGGVQSSVVVDKTIKSDEQFHYKPITQDNIENISVSWFYGGGIDIYFISLDVRYYTQTVDLVAPTGNLSFTSPKNFYTFNIGLKLFE